MWIGQKYALLMLSQTDVGKWKHGKAYRNPKRNRISIWDFTHEVKWLCATHKRNTQLLLMISYGQHNILANKWTNKQTRNASALPHDIHVLIFFRLDYLRYCCSILALYTENIDLFHHIDSHKTAFEKGKIFTMKTECLYACCQTFFSVKIQKKTPKNSAE